MIDQMNLISPDYLEQQKALHAEPRGFGTRGDKWAGILLQVAGEYQAWSILDYGCGQGSLVRFLKTVPLGPIRLDEYDPAIPGKDGPPGFADLVNVTDVLEHIEPDKLPAVLAHIKMLARKAVFVVVATGPSNRALPDGRDVHLTVESGRWWKKQFIRAGFELRRAPTVTRSSTKEWIGVLTP